MERSARVERRKDMKTDKPPFIAVWMLEHMTMGVRNEALAGDLLEDFRLGRSVSWYWRQVLTAIVLGFSRELRAQWPAAAFAFLWTLPVPAYWILFVVKMEQSTFITRAWHLAWPYSTFCDLAFANAWQVLYVCTG